MLLDQQKKLVGMLCMFDVLLYLRPKHIDIWGMMVLFTDNGMAKFRKIFETERWLSYDDSADRSPRQIRAAKKTRFHFLWLIRSDVIILSGKGVLKEHEKAYMSASPPLLIMTDTRYLHLILGGFHDRKKNDPASNQKDIPDNQS